MILYEDYFSNEKLTQPYVSAEEHLWEELRYLDMVLEHYLWRKGGIGDKKALSRGLVITESEIKSYLNTPPFLRVSDSCDPALAAQLSIAREHIAQRVEHTADAVTLPLAQVQRTFSLDVYEWLALLLALAAQVDVRYLRLFAFLQDDLTQKLPTVGLLEALYDQIAPESASHAEALVSGKKMDLYFLDLSENSGHIMLLTPLILKPQMRSLLLDRTLEEGQPDTILSVYRVQPDIPVFFLEQMSFLQSVYARTRREGRVTFLPVKGKEGAGRLLLAGQLANACGCELTVLDLRLFLELPQTSQRACIQQLLLRERLQPGIVYIRHANSERISGIEGQTLLSMLREQLNGVLICLGTPQDVKLPEDEAMLLSVDLTHTSERQRLCMWQYLTRELPLADDVSLEELADCYELTYREISRVVAQAVEETGVSAEQCASGYEEKDRCIGKQLFRKYLFQMNQSSFGELATRVPAVYSWEDILLEDRQRQVLKVACERYKLKNRVGENWGLFRKNAYGNGISILLYGPPGTGKTMAAQVMANEVGIPLYRVDLSRIYSKYVGETEKNLSAIFDRAKDVNVILFFDEADALFSKRTEVNSSHDRYSNSETSYLLQKMEEYNGISILATNLYNNFDNAFLRRLTFAVHFEKPDEKMRLRLWTTILPREVPVDPAVDFQFLAENFELSGSNIKAVLYNAVYMAASQGKALSMEHIVRSMKYELEKIGKMANMADFGMYGYYLKS